MPILYVKPQSLQEGGTLTPKQVQQQRKVDPNISTQNNKNVFVGQGLSAPFDETPKASQVYSYERVGTQGKAPVGRSTEDLKNLNPYYRRYQAQLANNPNAVPNEKIAGWTDQQYIDEAAGKLPGGQTYQQHAGRYFAVQPQQTDYTKHGYSTGQFYVTDRAGNVVPRTDYPESMQYNPNLVVDAPALRGGGSK